MSRLVKDNEATVLHDLLPLQHPEMKIWLNYAPSLPTLGSRVNPLSLLRLSPKLSAHPEGGRKDGCWWIPMATWWLGGELAQTGGSIHVGFLLFLNGIIWLFKTKRDLSMLLKHFFYRVIYRICIFNHNIMAFMSGPPALQQVLRGEAQKEKERCLF